MAGSKTLASIVLVYNNKDDKAYWVYTSVGTKLEELETVWEVIPQDASNYQVLADMAGPKPVILVEEVIQPKQGDTSEKSS